MVDVNGLKHENDTKGHAAGDLLIISTGKALANKFGRERVFRTGGDEFLVILQDFTREELFDGMTEVKEHLLRQGVSIAIGMSYCDDYDENFDSLQRHADAAMYADKALYYERSGAKRR